MLQLRSLTPSRSSLPRQTPAASLRCQCPLSRQPLQRCQRSLVCCPARQLVSQLCRPVATFRRPQDSIKVHSKTSLSKNRVLPRCQFAVLRGGEKELATQWRRSSTRSRQLGRPRRHQAGKQPPLARPRGVPLRLTTRQPLRLFRSLLLRNRIGRRRFRHQFPGRHRQRLSQHSLQVRLKCKRLRVTARRTQQTQQ